LAVPLTLAAPSALPLPLADGVAGEDEDEQPAASAATTPKHATAISRRVFVMLARTS
jgi:hypothetical protein